MNKRRSTILILFGLLCLLYAIFGRYLVLPGYLEGLEQGQSTLESAAQSVSGWKVARYLLWAYAFKLGLYLVALGAVVRTDMPATGRWAIALGGLAYIAFAYVPLPAFDTLLFGVAGGVMTVLMVVTFLRWARRRDQLPEAERSAADYRMAGYFFFAMATYTLCPLLGVKTFALTPEKMIAYGLQQEAASFALHALAELVLGWSFTFLGVRTSEAVQRGGAPARPQIATSFPGIKTTRRGSLTW